MATVRFLAALLVLWTGLAWAQPAYQAACSNRCTTCNMVSTSCTAVGVDRLAVVGEAHYPASANVTAITYGGVSIVGGLVDTQSALVEQNLYRVIAPAASAQTLQANVDAFAQMRVGAVLISGAHQTVPLGTAVKATGTGAAASATVSTAADELVVALAEAAAADVTLSAGANETERVSLSIAGEGETAMYTQPGASGGAMTPAMSASDIWLIIAVPVKSATAAAATGSARRRLW